MGLILLGIIGCVGFIGFQVFRILYDVYRMRALDRQIEEVKHKLMVSILRTYLLSLDWKEQYGSN